MAYPHAIRLAGPWEYELRSEEAGSTSGRVKASNDRPLAAVAAFRGAIVWSRKFGCPTNVDAGERVWLVIVAQQPGVALLNETPLGTWARAGETLEFDVTSSLNVRNRLTIETRSAGPAGAASHPILLPQVRLEVRRLWYVKNLVVTSGAQLAIIDVGGEVVGQPITSGELSLLIEGFDHELYFGPLGGLGLFRAAISAADLPALQGVTRVAADDVNVQLLRGGEVVWQSQA